MWKQDRANIFWQKRKRTRVGVTTNTAGANQTGSHLGVLLSLNAIQTATELLLVSII